MQFLLLSYSRAQLIVERLTPNAGGRFASVLFPARSLGAEVNNLGEPRLCAAP